MLKPTSRSTIEAVATLFTADMTRDTPPTPAPEEGRKLSQGYIEMGNEKTLDSLHAIFPSPTRGRVTTVTHMKASRERCNRPREVTFAEALASVRAAVVRATVRCGECVKGNCPHDKTLFILPNPKRPG